MNEPDTRPDASPAVAEPPPRRRPRAEPEREYARILPEDWQLLRRIGITIAVLAACPWVVSMQRPFALNVWELPAANPLTDWLWLFVIAATAAIAGSLLRPTGRAGAAAFGLGGTAIAGGALWLVLDQTPSGVVDLTGMAWGVALTAALLVAIAAGARLCLDDARAPIGRGMLGVAGALLLVGAFWPTELPVLDPSGPPQQLMRPTLEAQAPWLFQIDVIGALFHPEAGSGEFTIVLGLAWIMLSPLIGVLALRHAVWPIDPEPDVRNADRAPGLGFARFWAMLFVPVLLLVSMVLTWLQAMALTLVLVNMAVVFGVGLGAAAHGLAASLRASSRAGNGSPPPPPADG